MAEICYTSGTTGHPKGALLTHGNYIASLTGVLIHIEKFIKLSEQTLLSFLPLAHSLGVLAEAMIYASGGRVAMYSGDIRLLIQDMQDVQPTVMVTIPRLLDNIYNRICYSVKGSTLKTKLMEFALKSKEKEFQA